VVQSLHNRLHLASNGSWVSDKHGDEPEDEDY
jgi:hypothetical protein